MSSVEYVVGWMLVIGFFALVGFTIGMWAHDRGGYYDHGPGCRWCHPRLRRRKAGGR